MQRRRSHDDFRLLTKLRFSYQLIRIALIFRVVIHTVDGILRSLRTKRILDVTQRFDPILFVKFSPLRDLLLRRCTGFFLHGNAFFWRRAQLKLRHFFRLIETVGFLRRQCTEQTFIGSRLGRTAPRVFNASGRLSRFDQTVGSFCLVDTVLISKRTDSLVVL